MQQPGRIKSPALGLRRYGIPLLVAALLGSLVLQLWGVKLHPYRLDVLQVSPHAQNSTFGTIQFNQDPRDELVVCRNKEHAGYSCGCTVYSLNKDSRREAIDHYIIKGRLIKGQTQAISSDYDQNGQEELGILHYKGDSLFYSVFDRSSDRPSLRLHLDSLGLDQGRGFAGFYKIGEYDLNRDGYLETYFYVGAHYAMYPRRVYCIDLAGASVRASPRSAVGFQVRPFGRKTKGTLTALTGHNHMPANIDPGYPYPWPDTTGFAYAFKPDLSWLVKPKALAHYLGNVINFLKGDSLISPINHSNPNASPRLQYRKLPKGNLIKEGPWEYQAIRLKSYDPDYVATNADHIQLFSPSLKEKKRRMLPPLRSFSHKVNQLFTGEDAFFLISSRKKPFSCMTRI